MASAWVGRKEIWYRQQAALLAGKACMYTVGRVHEKGHIRVYGLDICGFVWTSHILLQLLVLHQVPIVLEKDPPSMDPSIYVYP